MLDEPMLGGSSRVGELDLQEGFKFYLVWCFVVGQSFRVVRVSGVDFVDVVALLVNVDFGLYLFALSKWRVDILVYSEGWSMHSLIRSLRLVV